MLKKILLTNADNLQNDCLSIWVKYDEDKSGFLDQKELNSLINDIAEIFFEKNWEDSLCEFEPAKLLGKEKFKARWSDYFISSVSTKCECVIDEDMDGKISKEEFIKGFGSVFTDV